MKRLLFAYLLCACAALVAAEDASANNVSTNKAPAGVRNPFWPRGYEGEREIISPNARPKPKPNQAPAKARSQRPALSPVERERLAAEKAAAEKAAAEKAAKEAAARAEAERKKREVTDAHWGAARAALSLGSYMTLNGGDSRRHASVVINGKVYADGDLVSITHDSRRFTWRFVGLSDENQPILAPIRAKYLEKSGEAGEKSDKGAKP